MYNVYLLKLKDGSIYTGSTRNLKERLDKHKKGFVVSTKDLRPVKLIWMCQFGERIKALRFERYLKTGSGQAFRNKRLT